MCKVADSLRESSPHSRSECSTMRALMARAIFVLLFCGHPAAAESLEQAERAFQHGVENRKHPLQAQRAFSEAVDHYLVLHEQGVRNPDLYLNLANAAYLADRWPEALWAYHVGLKLDPNHRLLREHRDFARGKVLYPPSGHGQPESETWPTWLYRPPLWVLALIAGIGYPLTCCTMAAAFLARRSSLLMLAMLFLLIAAAAGFGLWYGMKQAEIDRETPLVIVSGNTPLYRGNGVNYPQHSEYPRLARGLEVRQLHRRGGWLQVRVSSGEIGWIPLARALIVEP